MSGLGTPCIAHGIHRQPLLQSVPSAYLEVWPRSYPVSVHGVLFQGRSARYTQPQLNSCTASHCSRVYGNSYENVLVAVVVPDKKALTAWAGDNGLGNASFEELCDNPKVRTYARHHCSTCMNTCQVVKGY